MDNVTQVDSVTCMGMHKEEFKAMYFTLRPFHTDEDFEREWSRYTYEKAKHIAELNRE